jgi:peptidoglycan-N-acetylglucosamine deacetylase
VLTAHPFLSGRPSRAAALERLIERMRELDGLWIASLDEVAAYAESLNLPARQLPPPQLQPA